MNGPPPSETPLISPGVRPGPANQAAATSPGQTQPASGEPKLISVAETLDNLRQLPSGARNPLANPVKLLDDADKQTLPAMAAQQRQYAIDALQTAINRNPSIATEPLAQLLIGLASIRLDKDPSVYRDYLSTAYRYNETSIRPYDFDPDHLKAELKLTDEERRQLALAQQLANQRGGRGGRGGGLRGGRGGGLGGRQGFPPGPGGPLDQQGQPGQNFGPGPGGPPPQGENGFQGPPPNQPQQ